MQWKRYCALLRRIWKHMKRKIRSKHNDLLNYFIHDERSLAKRRAYVASCRKFLKEISLKQQAASVKQSPQLKDIRYYVNKKS